MFFAMNQLLQAEHFSIKPNRLFVRNEEQTFLSFDEIN